MKHELKINERERERDELGGFFFSFSTPSIFFGEGGGILAPLFQMPN